MRLNTLNRCTGRYGELGFCAPSGAATFRDNGTTFGPYWGTNHDRLTLAEGRGCGGATPDCDVIAGAISGCHKIEGSQNATTARMSTAATTGASAASGSLLTISDVQIPVTVTLPLISLSTHGAPSTSLNNVEIVSNVQIPSAIFSWPRFGPR